MKREELTFNLDDHFLGSSFTWTCSMSGTQFASVRGVEGPDDSISLTVVSGMMARGVITGVSVMLVAIVLVLEPQTERPSHPR